ncbi:MAG: hypothetical protein V4735_03310 [Pseudomonadota bacterium]
MQLVMPFARSTSYDAADYIRGSSNADALDLIERWPDWPYSLMLVHGPRSAGKTHLAHVFARRAQAHFIDTARIGTVPADLLLTGNHCWVLDGVETVADAAALAQLINHLRARGDYLLMTAATPAAQLPFTLPDLRSRLNALPAVALHAPDDALLMGVLAKHFADRQLRVAPEVLHYAASHLERSYDAVQTLARILDKLSLTRNKPVTIVLVKEAIASSS